MLDCEGVTFLCQALHYCLQASSANGDTTLCSVWVGGHGTPLFSSTEGTSRVFMELERITIPPAHDGTGKHWISNSLSRALILLAFLFRFSIAVTLTVQPSLSTLKRVSTWSVNNENPWVLFNSLNSFNKHLLNTYYVPVLLNTRNTKMNKPYTLAHKILNLLRESIKERIFQSETWSWRVLLEQRKIMATSSGEIQQVSYQKNFFFFFLNGEWGRLLEGEDCLNKACTDIKG